MGQLHNKDYDFLIEITRLEMFKRAIHNKGSKMRGNQVESNKSQDIVLGDKLANSFDGENLLLADYVSKVIILVFSRSEARESLKSSTKYSSSNSPRFTRIHRLVRPE